MEQAVDSAKQEAVSASFSTFNFHPRIEAGIRGESFSEPTPIQSRCIPSILGGRDMIGLAQTGTGKTAAFVLPILQRLMGGIRHSPRALIVAPTRELADQIHETLLRLGRKTGLKSAVVYGGVGKGPQVRGVASAEVVVACPGRLLDLVSNREINLSRIEMFVLDEADRMFDMGFLPDIRKVAAALPRRRQTLLFSATMPPDIRRLAEEILENPVNIRVGNSAPVSTISHSVYPVEQHLKTQLLMRLLEGVDTKSVLIFTRTKHRATRLAARIGRDGYAVASLQGDLPQSKRQSVLSGYRSGKYRILVATDIAARGIDISTISHVINYDMPDTVDAYTHRIGRTGRAERTGDALSFMTRGERGFVGDVERVLGKPIKKEILADFNYNAPAPTGSGGSHVAPGTKIQRTPVRDGQQQVPGRAGRKGHFSASSGKNRPR